MATARSQKRWREKNRPVKRQLNVMARGHVHATLDTLARTYNLRGKGEAVSFACFLAEALMQRADYSADAARILADVSEAYHRDRELYTT